MQVNKNKCTTNNLQDTADATEFNMLLL